MGPALAGVRRDCFPIPERLLIGASEFGGLILPEAVEKRVR
jgi:hypothetical protein